MRSVRSRMSAVTNGLPSRSPPIHEPIRKNDRTSGIASPGWRRCSSSSSAPYSLGSSRRNVCSKNDKPLATSSSTPSFLEPQHPGLPERQHGASRRLLVLGELLRRQAFALTGLQQPLEPHFEVAHALALYLGRVRRQHRHDQAVAHEGRQRLRANAGGLDAIERAHEAALGRRLAGDVGLPRAPAAVQVLGQVGQVREITERAHHDHRLLAAQRIEHLLEFATRLDIVVAPECDRALAHAFDHLERVAALLVAHRVAEQPAQQPDIVAHRAVGLVVEIHCRGPSHALSPFARAHYSRPAPGEARPQPVCGRGPCVISP